MAFNREISKIAFVSWSIHQPKFCYVCRHFGSSRSGLLLSLPLSYFVIYACLAKQIQQKIRKKLREFDEAHGQE
jgi:hypothetical protein